jgi:hypothetical protein
MKLFYRSLLGGLVLFFYQFISFAGANFHGNAQAYTEKQDTILAFLNGLNLENKQYILPRPAENATPEDQQKFATESQGKPWAMVNYHSTKNTGMIMPMVRGLLVDILAIFLLFGLLDKIADINTQKSIIYSCTVGFFSFIVVPYTNYIWYQTPDVWAHLLDALVPYTILGALYARFWRSAA